MTPVRNLLAICATSGFLVFSRAEASERLSHDIAAQPLAQALSEVATQTGLQIVYVSGIAASRDSKGAPRGLPAPDALQQLLAGTGLRFEFLNDRTVRIFAGSSCVLPSGCTGPPIGAATLAPERLPGPPSSGDRLEEVLVTGARWWLDPTVAMAPVTVLDRRDIERGGESSIGDVLQALPMSTGSLRNTNLKDRKSTRLNSSHGYISYAVFCLKKKTYQQIAEKRSCPVCAIKTQMRSALAQLRKVLVEPVRAESLKDADCGADRIRSCFGVTDA